MSGREKRDDHRTDHHFFSRFLKKTLLLFGFQRKNIDENINEKK